VGAFVARIGRAELACIVLSVLAFSVPFLTHDRLFYSISNQIMIAVIAAFSVFIMLRMNLISFAVPAFMAIGGYAAAIAARNGLTDVFALMAIAFAFPALVALPLGALVLRLRGVYFVLVTYILSEILQLFLFETPGLTGGSNGIAGIPAATFFGISLGRYEYVLLTTAGILLLATVITAATTRYYGQQFSAIEENEVLAQSLGLVVWRYKVIGFVIAGGVAGLGGYALVTMLLTAHPSSFSSFSGVSYITYAIVGGRTSILGPVVGSTILVWASNLFSSQAQYSQGLFGVLIVFVIFAAKGGIVGTAEYWLKRWLRKRSDPGAGDDLAPVGRSKDAA